MKKRIMLLVAMVLKSSYGCAAAAANMPVKKITNRTCYRVAVQIKNKAGEKEVLLVKPDEQLDVQHPFDVQTHEFVYVMNMKNR